MSYLSLKELLLISDTMCRLVSGMLGPTGNQTLLSTATGKAIASRDGLKVLSAVYVNHPVAKCILSTMKNYHILTGDGSKSFLIYLQAILKAVEKLASTSETYICKRYSESPYFRISLSQKLHYFLLEEFPFFSSVMLEKCTLVCTEMADFCSTIRIIVTTVLNTTLPGYATDLLTEMLCSFFDVERFFTWDQDQIDKCLSQVLGFLDSYHVKISGYPYEKSEIYFGVLLEQEFVVPLPDLRSTEKNLHVIMISCQIEDDSCDTVSPTHKLMEKCFLQKRTKILRFVEALKAAGIDVILLSECCPVYFQGICRDHLLSVVQNVDKDKVSLIQHLTGAVPLHDLREEFMNNGTFIADVCKRMKIGRKSFILVKPSKIEEPCGLAKQMILCAPTNSMCDQACDSLKKAILSLRMCLCFQRYISSSLTACKPSSKALTVNKSGKDTVRIICAVGPGGCFEALLWSVIQQHKSGEKSLCREMNLILREMLLSVPQRLCTNNSPSYFQGQHDFLRKWSAMVQGASTGLALGFNCSADIIDMSMAGILEPLPSKLLLVSCVIQLVQQLLRLDAVVGVKKH